MKRSEMIKYLVGLLRMPRFSPVSDEILAEEILTALEANGMVPPAIKKETVTRAQHPQTKEEGNFIQYLMRHEWEKE